MMINVGDVFAVATKNGKAYFQFVKKISPMGSLIRVLPGTYHEKPDLDVLVEEKTNFWVFFPVSAALKKGIIQKAKVCIIPAHSQETPTFRAGVVDSSTGRVETWWFWNEEEEWEVGKITEEQRKFPIRGSWNDTLLVQRIEEGWSPEKDRR
ncbi:MULTISPECIES: hypothetical protein [Pseudomonas]|nr:MULTISPECIES: hypothetical protein [Pseudomonas]